MKPASKLVRCYAVISDGPDDSLVKWPCLADPNSRWNGWARPQFTLRTIRKFAKAGLLVPIASPNPKEELLFADPQHSMDPEEASVAFRHPNGRWEWSGFCFDIVTDSGRTIERTA